VHAIDPGESEYDPGTHAVQMAALAAPNVVENVPAAHSWQSDTVAAPTVTE
jgi:hypothetical protein